MDLQPIPEQASGKDTYGVIETPESSGLIPAADPAVVPAFPPDHSTSHSGPNENP